MFRRPNTAPQSWVQAPPQAEAPGAWPLRRMKIAHVTATFPPYPGGTGQVCLQNALALTRLGHEVEVFTTAIDDAPAEEVMQGVTVHRLRPLLRAGTAAVLPSLLWRLRGFDMIHLHYPFLGGEVAALAARLTRTPLVITYHQDMIFTGLPGVIQKMLCPTLERWALRGAARLLFTSLDYGKVSGIWPLLRGRERIIDELPNGVDMTLFHPDAPEVRLRDQHHLAPEDLVVLVVARLDSAHYYKGINIFLDALTRLPPHVKAIIIGDGDLRQSYQLMARVLGLGSRVQFPSHVPVGDLPRYYRMAAMTVLPSTTMGEAFGRGLVESLASGIPAIASDLPGVRTVIDHGSDGLLVQPGNPAALAGAIGRLARYATMREVMGMRGRAKVTDRYHWPLLGRRLETLYAQALDDAATLPVLRLRRNPVFATSAVNQALKDG